MGAATEGAPEAGPRTNKGSGGAPGFVDVAYAFLVKDVLEFAPKLGPRQRLGKEITLEVFILEGLADFVKSFLPVDQGFD
jgi:hypothetical protein